MTNVVINRRHKKQLLIIVQETLATENPISGDILHMTLKDCKLPGALRKKCETTIHGRFYSNKIFTASLMQNTI